MKTLVLVAVAVLFGGAGCASSGVAHENTQAELLESAALPPGTDATERLLDRITADQADALLGGQRVKLAPDQAVLLAEVIATYGTRRAALDALRGTWTIALAHRHADPHGVALVRQDGAD
jgi:hypothetical protein